MHEARAMSSTFMLFFLTALAILMVAFFVYLNIRERKVNTKVRAEIEDTFRGLATDLLKSQSETFTELAKGRLDRDVDQQKSHFELTKKEVEGLLGPLNTSLEEYRKQLKSLEEKRAQDVGSLDQMMKILMQGHADLKQETHNLVHALKRPTTRGRWGEVQLRRIVELSGMSRFCDFTEQVSATTDEGRLRPDMIIKLPSGREIILDSKAVLDAYLDAESAETEEKRKLALTRHALSLRTRIQELSRKAYWDQFKTSPEFVVLFIPAEAFFSAALEESPDLVEYAFTQKIVLATPTTLMALLKAVAFGWRQEQLAENARKISEQASKVFDGVNVWLAHYEDVGKNLDRALKSFNNSVGSLERSVLPPVRRMKELGVGSKAEMPSLNRSETSLRQSTLFGGKALDEKLPE